MAANASRSKLSISRMDRKLNKKITKAKVLFSKEDNVFISEQPTRFLCILNAGLTTNASREILLEIFERYGMVEDIILIHGKQYSFIIYHDVESASVALRQAQGMPLSQEEASATLCIYLCYVSQVPEQSGRLPKNNEFPSGLIVLKNWISEEYEKQLLQSIDWDTEIQDNKQRLKHRRVKHFGYEFKYDINNVEKENPLPQKIPEVCQYLLDTLKCENYILEDPDQLTVNLYEPGQGIPPHIDTHSAFDDGILSLSLGSDIAMDFYHPNGSHVSVLLPRRSVLIMTDESRYLWSHGITPRKTDVVSTDDGCMTLQQRKVRISFTFRHIRRGLCQCKYTDFCDSQIGNRKIKMTNESDVAALEEIYVQKVYDAIANHFSTTRHKPWPRVQTFLKNLACGSIVVDVGCGNGKYLNENPNVVAIGCDRSMKLNEICHAKKFEAFCCDILALPLRSQIADACICIAVIHHLLSEERRIEAIANLGRITKPGGKILIYVWAMEQDVDGKSGYVKESRAKSKQDNAINGDTSSRISCAEPDSHSSCIEPDGNQNTSQHHRHGKLPFPVHINRTRFEHQDILVPWHLKTEGASEETIGSVYYRYYHVFQQGELESLCLKVTDLKVIDSYYDKGNWCTVLEKLS